MGYTVLVSIEQFRPRRRVARTGGAPAARGRTVKRTPQGVWRCVGCRRKDSLFTVS